MSLTPYASSTELAAFWRSLDSDETNRADIILSKVSNLLRQIAVNNGFDLDVKITADLTGLYAESVKTVTLAAAKRAMSTPVDAPPADQWSQSASPYSESMTFTNPSNDIFFKTNELRLLGLSGVSGRSQFGVLSGVRC